ncbi:HNH endonuclease signature motif containing protein [Blastococcus sp. PRF04-17]|uniref:HNH endonuclease signature motif containing protein n=1 Tax=Blastococcus sp. PRF04-17 TaxID=2933797 RepID=UPI001FF3D0E7|nr:HNH endonuclease signature motif containing protein [Blastococcus sp. PRF04-17]UOY00525.1 HNH endonuclease [Blastococcus sp. PRF04-17]
MARSSGGRVYTSGHLDPVGAETVHAALEAVMNGYRPAGDHRSHAERMGDALVELCRQSLNAGRLPEVRGQSPHVRVAIDLLALCAHRGTPGFGELPFAGPISAETARRIACDAGVSRIIVGPNSLPLDVGREQRLFPVGIRRAIEQRDRHCVFAGCTAPPAWCDVHHVDHWAWGGETSCETGALVCEHHHTAVHEGGFRVVREAGTAAWHTYRPDGSEVTVRVRGPAP